MTKSISVLFILFSINTLSLAVFAAPGCVGQTTYCFDGCTGTNSLQIDADSCSVAFDPQRGCNYGFGYCSK
jgi:hypothetical protein